MALICLIEAVKWGVGGWVWGAATPGKGGG